MATGSGKVPPRFVPTLTEVVQPPPHAITAPVGKPLGSPVHGSVAHVGRVEESRVSVPKRPEAAPPLPTPPAARADTRVGSSPAQLATGPVPSAAVSPGSTAGETIASSGPALADGVEEYMVHRVMQRVDVILDQRLREAIAAVIQEQTRSVLPRLREEIESVVRHAVYEAVADELASPPSSTPVR